MKPIPLTPEEFIQQIYLQKGKLESKEISIDNQNEVVYSFIGKMTTDII